MSKPRKKRYSLLYYTSIIIFLIFTLVPIAWAFLISITPEYEIFKNSKTFLPEAFTLDNYKTFFNFTTRQSILFFSGMKNSLKTAFITILITLPVSVLFAYPMSRMRFKYKILIRNTILITMAIPVFTTIIPLYKVYSDLRLLDNFFWLSLVYVTSFLPVNTWLISNYFDTIPSEIEDAAFIDGCNRISVFTKVILPISKPAILSSILMIFLMTMSQFQIPLILASSRFTKPISIVASEFVVKDGIKYGLTTAAGILAIIPPAMLAIIFRRFLIRAVTNGATKG